MGGGGSATYSTSRSPTLRIPRQRHRACQVYRGTGPRAPRVRRPPRAGIGATARRGEGGPVPTPGRTTASPPASRPSSTPHPLCAEFISAMAPTGLLCAHAGALFPSSVMCSALRFACSLVSVARPRSVRILVRSCSLVAPDSGPGFALFALGIRPCSRGEGGSLDLALIRVLGIRESALRHLRPRRAPTLGQLPSTHPALRSLPAPHAVRGTPSPAAPPGRGCLRSVSEMVAPLPSGGVPGGAPSWSPPWRGRAPPHPRTPAGRPRGRASGSLRPAREGTPPGSSVRLPGHALGGCLVRR